MDFIYVAGYLLKNRKNISHMSDIININRCSSILITGKPVDKLNIEKYKQLIKMIFHQYKRFVHVPIAINSNSLSFRDNEISHDNEISTFISNIFPRCFTFQNAESGRLKDLDELVKTVRERGNDSNKINNTNNSINSNHSNHSNNSNRQILMYANIYDYNVLRINEYVKNNIHFIVQDILNHNIIYRRYDKQLTDQFQYIFILKSSFDNIIYARNLYDSFFKEMYSFTDF